MASCMSCGVPLPGNARFCSQCGAAVQADAAGEANLPAGPAAPAAASAAAGTEPLWTGWPSPKRHVPALAGGLFLVLAPLLALAVLRPAQAALTIGLLTVAAFGLLWSAWTAIQMALDPIQLRYWVTVDRLFIRRGILSQTTDQMELIRVDDIRVRQSLIERLLDIGHVEITATSDRTDSAVALVGVREPMVPAELIRENMRRVRQRRGMYIENV